MTKQIWLNLPVKDAAKSKAFYSEIGFNFLEERTTAQSACMLVGESNFVVMLFADTMFQILFSMKLQTRANQLRF
jgi:predicted lactoylglutathione lyase